ncbi:MAG TPA: DUF5682 family protein [Acidimicrobiales bacterium]|nr:DUF5682 family protein [Acidimicrobiales bacterium]
MAVRVFGIRHHGPGSARALGAALDEWRPDAVLVEGPPEAAPVLSLAADPAMRPPVALLGYVPGRPGRAVFYPMAVWSPEWVAVRHALDHGAEPRMIDLSLAAWLAEEPGDEDEREATPVDPIGRLAEAAGYDDPERWWEDVVEHRPPEEGPWDAIAEAMAVLRADRPPVRGREARREAAMRQQIRAAVKDGRERVAVVCGAWHAPALAELGPARPDAELLARLPRTKVAVTWVPWTSARLAMASGYGAGVRSPGWYQHLYVTPDRPVERWLARVARLLRAENLDAAPASVVEAVRLAEALATLRGRALAGLAECTDAARAVLAHGSDLPLALVERKLVVGEELGQVPPDTPMVPLAADLAALQRRLRLRPEPTERVVDLDLRKENDLARSHLLHRLGLLGVPWGSFRPGQGTGTFRETWVLAWEPELSVAVIEAGGWGTTVEEAATARAAELAAGAPTVGALTALVEQCLLAELGAAVPPVMDALAARAAVAADTGELLDAVPPLARVLRYGSVRKSDVSALDRVIAGLVTRAAVGIGPACASLDDDSAADMAARVTAMTDALATLGRAELRGEWSAALGRLVDQPGLHGAVAGRVARLLFDAGRLAAADVARRLSAALSLGEEPRQGAAWVEGLLAGSGLVLVHHQFLLAAIDEWVATVDGAVFDDLLPLLRRSFSRFEPGERHQIGRAVRRLAPGEQAPPDAAGGEVDRQRAEAVLPLVRLLLGGRE